MKKSVLENFAKNTCAGLRPETLLKKETLAQVFSCEFCEIFKNTFFKEHLRTTAFILRALVDLFWTKRLFSQKPVLSRGKNRLIILGTQVFWCIK